MLFGKRGPRTGGARRRATERLKIERLEDRQLLAIDLGGVTPPPSPNASAPLPTIATITTPPASTATPGNGIDMAGANTGGGAGFGVTNVGDVNADGFDDFVVGAPSATNATGPVSIGSGVNSTVYLVFGSNQVNQTSFTNWLNNTPGQRVGDLGQLGNSFTTQTNPITGLGTATPSNAFAFNGIKFITSQNITSQLGASVAALGTVHPGANSFVLGAPGAGINGNPLIPGGRAYVIYGGSGLNALSGRTIDLDNTSVNQGLGYVTYVTNNAGARLGASVGGPGDVFADQTTDLAIGAPNATYNGLPNAGLAYLVDGNSIPTIGSNGLPPTVLVDTVGQTGGPTGVIFGGTNAGDQLGTSISGAGDVRNVVNSVNTRVQDLLIGATGASAVYLVYGNFNGINLPNLATPVGGLNSIAVSRLGAPGTASNTVPGALFAGLPGDGTGFAVSTAGDFNADGADDFLIGSPFFNTNTGRVTLIYGQQNTSNNLFGTISLNSIPTNVPAIQYTGAAINALAGYSVSQVGRINLTSGVPNPILIGSPGFASNTGAAYLIPGNTSTPVGTFSLASAEAQPVAATQFTFTTPGGVSAPFFGASVSGRPLFITSQANTADFDQVGDFVIGAPGYAATGARGLAGGAMILEGARVPLQTPASTSITTQISVDAPLSTPPPYRISSSSPTTIQIFVASVASANFHPVTDIDPATIVVNGVAFAAANVTITADPNDENNDGIPDAIVTLTPRSALNLNASNTSLTINGRTLATSPIPNMTFTGTTSIIVNGGGGGGGGGAVGAATPIGLFVPDFFLPPMGPERFVPQPSTLSAFNYKPIPKRVAYRQYLPDLGFQMRILNYTDPAKYHFQAARTASPNKNGSSLVLPKSTFNQSAFHPGKRLAFTHSRRVIPTQFQHQNLTPRQH